MVYFPARPDEKANDLAGKNVRVRITEDHKVFIGDRELPGWIAEHGVKLEVSTDCRDFNRMTVQFIVGDITIADEQADKVEVRATAAAYSTCQQV
jgi:hypothetical protein